MKFAPRIPLPRLTVLAGAACLFGVWLLGHLDALTAPQNGWIRFCLSLVFAVLILIRRKPGSAGYTPAFTAMRDA